MKNRKKLLIIDKHQYGTLVDVCKWCEHLKDDYDITLICFDGLSKKEEVDGFRIKYVSNAGNYTVRGIRYILVSLWNILFWDGCILVEYFPKCSVFKKIFFRKKMILDIRTLSVDVKDAGRQKYNSELKKTLHLYDKILVISFDLLRKLEIDIESKYSELPLGGDVLDADKKYDDLKLLYVGGLSDRNIDLTLKGVGIFRDKYPDSNLTYTLICKGSDSEVRELRNLCEKLSLESSVSIMDAVPHSQLLPYFKICNVGVSFIPITDYYDLQPPTKTFEYILSGMICLATATSANTKLITPDNGVIHNDNAVDFAKALEYVYMNRQKYDSEKIRRTLSPYTWKNIVETCLKPLFD